MNARYLVLSDRIVLAEPKLEWTVLDAQGVKNGHYDFGGAALALKTLQRDGVYGPYTLRPLSSLTPEQHTRMHRRVAA